jgi:hypothetical protein
MFQDLQDENLVDHESRPYKTFNVQIIRVALFVGVALLGHPFPNLCST